MFGKLTPQEYERIFGHPPEAPNTDLETAAHTELRQAVNKAHQDALAAEAENRERVHNSFGLSYASYLVLPRVILEQMDGEWQRRFTECLEELGESWKSEALSSYKVQRVEGECDRSCEACTDGPQPDADDCECCGECEREVSDPLGEYRHPDMTFIQGLRRS